MDQQHTAADQILQAVKAHPDCALGHLIRSLPELSWFEVFHEVDRLGRTGRIKFSRNSLGLATTLRVQ
ncbi:protein of unknown function [Nitrospira japonica]|uniref:Uncharacterized protein n=1 Tax=Nitrospira japonica TaxID=1325564 RepID=A0A1W1I967_9BACT|nr:hypothetical protein [Nitrospira japonica]SLM49481.1 protein of unknown function [Nitrospira japonica]